MLKCKMKYLLIIIMGMVLVATASAYHWENTHNISLDVDFVNGGINGTQGNVKIVGDISDGTQPFNGTGATFEVFQGLLYIIWSDEVLIDFDVIPPTVSCTIPNKGIEWGEVNCTSDDDNVTWSVSIKDSRTGELYEIFDTRTGAERKFVGLKEAHKYIIQVNATDSDSNIGPSETEFQTKVGGEKTMASLAVVLFVGAITFSLFFIGWKFQLSQHPLTNYILKHCCILFGLFLLSLDTTMVATIADVSELGVTQEIFRYLWIINWTIYIAMVVLLWKTLQGSLSLWENLTAMKRMGEDE